MNKDDGSRTFFKGVVPNQVVYHKPHWSLWLLLIIAMVFCISIFVYMNHRDNESLYKTEIITIELKDTNKIIYDDVVDYLCDDNVKVDSVHLLWRDYMFYTSTWEDGKVPHSEGKCYVKIKVLK